MKNNRKGFTTVELVIVIAVIAILAAVLIPTFTGLIEKANISSIKQEARNAYTQYVTNTLPNTAATTVYVEIDGEYYQAIDGVVSDDEAKKTNTTRPTTGTLIDTNGNVICITHTYDTNDSDGKCNVCNEVCEHSGDPCTKCGFNAP